jgi:UDP-N-acetylmuramate dehydrogenase
MSDYTLRADAPLEARSTFRVQARAELLADVRSADGLADLLVHPDIAGRPTLVLGEGSNLLFAGAVEGLVLSLAMSGIEVLADDGERASIRVAAGERWDDLVGWSVARGFHGLENMALIPGSVGAAPIQNIGAYGAEVAEFIDSVEAFDRQTLDLVRMSASACAFGYRDSIFKRQPERWVIVAVEFVLDRVRPLRLDYAGVRETLAAMGVDAPRPVHLAEAISRIRVSKLPNPALVGNAGSFFKNPTIAAPLANALGAAFPGLPVFGHADGQAKLSAAWLIEHCGWKGVREGDAGVSDMHALVLVNHGRATGLQILDLAHRVAASVEQRFGVALEPEPRIVGERW